MKLLDTTVAVDHLRGDPRASRLLEELLDNGELLLASEVTRFELLAGVRAGEREATERFMSAFSWVPIDEEISRLAGSLANEYRAAHSGIGVVDYLLAATASVLGADIVTTNVRHFPMVPGLQPPYPS